MDTPKVDEATVAEQAAVAHRFIEGLLNAFGLEGTVTSRVEEDTVHIDVNGEQTEALVGSKGAVMQAVHEIRDRRPASTASAPQMRLESPATPSAGAKRSGSTPPSWRNKYQRRR